MWAFNKIKQYQLVQEDKMSYKLRLNGAKGIYQDNEIINVFKSFLGEDANIYIEHVEGIPLLKSGKFRTTICKYKPNEK
jgi:phenylacetate-CoA ligase